MNILSVLIKSFQIYKFTSMYFSNVIFSFEKVYPLPVLDELFKEVINVRSI